VQNDTANNGAASVVQVGAQGGEQVWLVHTGQGTEGGHFLGAEKVVFGSDLVHAVTVESPVRVRQPIPTHPAGVLAQPWRWGRGTGKAKAGAAAPTTSASDVSASTSTTSALVVPAVEASVPTDRQLKVLPLSRIREIAGEWNEDGPEHIEDYLNDAGALTRMGTHANAQLRPEIVLVLREQAKRLNGLGWHAKQIAPVLNSYPSTVTDYVEATEDVDAVIRVLDTWRPELGPMLSFLKDNDFPEAGSGKRLPPHILVPVMEKTRELRKNGKGGPGQPFKRHTRTELGALVGLVATTVRAWTLYWTLGARWPLSSL